MPWQVCPICLGKGVVSPGFYETGAYSLTTGWIDEKCRSCNGSGVLYDPVPSQNIKRAIAGPADWLHCTVTFE